jgi:peroxiredoxin
LPKVGNEIGMQANSLEEAFKQICVSEGPLHERLAAFSAAVRLHGLPFAEAYDELVARLRSEKAGSTAPGPGDMMPSFLLPDKNGLLYDLKDLLAKGPAVISFNRGHWCEYCAIELTALSRAMEKIRARGATTVCIMPEPPELTAKVSARIKDAFSVLSDFDNSYAQHLGLTIWLGDRVRNLYVSHGLHVDRFQGNGRWFVAIPATYVVGQDGHILARHVDPDFRSRMDIEDIIAALPPPRH